MTLARLRAAASLGLAAVGVLGGCAVIYPEIETPIRKPPETAEMQPAPPPDLFYVRITEVEVPPRTRDGRAWDRSGEGKADPFAVVYIDGKELFKTATARDSHNPTWPEQKQRNYTIPKGATLKVEVWNDNAIRAQPICIQTVKNVRARAAEMGGLDLYCDGGGRIVIEFVPAKARWGLGMYYELRGEGPRVTRVVRHSPASRAGLRGGEQILAINGRKVGGMGEREVRSAINANIRTGLDLHVRSSGELKRIKVEEGPIYTLEDQ